MSLDKFKRIAKIDRENMRDLLVSFPSQCRDALFISEKSKVASSYKKDYANIVFTGLGGSAIGADIVRVYVENEVKIPIFVNRNYAMPHFVGNDTLVFAVSYSGNTEETLSAYSDALKRGSKIVVITSGGKLKELAEKHSNACVLIPKGYPPRCALGYSFIPALIVLSKLGIIKDKRGEIKKVVALLKNIEKGKLNPAVRGKANISKYIAKRLYKKFPVIYSSSAFDSIATRWRGQFAENAKTLSSMHVFPEMNHNEIVGWDHPRYLLWDFVAIILRDRGDHPRVKIRMDIIRTILKKNKFEVIEVESKGSGLLERMLSLVYIGDFTSFYLSILNKVDPTPVERITYLKEQLAKR